MDSATTKCAQPLGIALAVLLCAVAPAYAVDAIWIGPATGAFNNPTYWSTGTVPTFNTTALIDDNPAQNSRVESTTNRNISLLGIGTGDTLAVINSSFGTGLLPLDGAISVEGTGQFTTGTVVLNSGSEIRLSGMNATATTSFLFNEGLIHGGGRFAINPTFNGAASINQSTVRADNPSIPLALQLSNLFNFINNGSLMATGGGRLQIYRSYSSSPVGIVGGRIEAHPGSTVALGAISNYAYVENAVLAMIEDGDPLTSAPAFEFTNAELKNVTLEGNFKLSGTTVQGSLTNSGEITPGPTYYSSPYYHNVVKGDVSLIGGGTVSLGSSPYALFGTGFGSTTNRLINVDNAIRGSGELLVSWYGFTNRHVVQAEGPGELVFYNGLSDGLFVNAGVMKATNGGRLRLGYSSGATAVMENFEGADMGEIVAEENSSVLLNLIHIKGGVLRAVGDNPATRGKFLAESLVVLENLTTQGVFRFQTFAGQLSTITVEGTINNTGAMTGRYSVGQSAQLTGGGEFIGESGTLISLGIQNSSLVNIDNVIHGSGNINTSFTNNQLTNRGTIRSDGAITFASQLPVVNQGRLEAGSSAQLTLPTLATVRNRENGVDGVIHAADGGVVNFGRIEGGVLSTEGTGVIRGTNAFITDLRNAGTLEANGVVPQGAIVNDGVIKGRLISSAFARLEGSGRWETSGANLDTGVFVNGPQHTILGSGNLATSASATTMFINEGTIRAVDGPQLNIFGMSFENSGLVDAPTGRTIGIHSSFTRVENSGTLQVDGTMGVTAPLGLYNFDGALIDVGGQLTLEQTVLRNRVGGIIVGSGTIAGAITSGPLVVNEGIIEPGAGIAALQIDDDFQQHSVGQLQMGIAGGDTPTSDLLAVNGLATLAGTLVATLVGEQSLSLHDSFTFLTATGGISGIFDQWVLPALPDDQFWYIEYGANEVRATVEQIIPGDFNLDGTVDAADYVALIKTGANETQLGEWKSNFGSSVANAPPPLSATVPEPATLSILLSAAAVAFWLRIRAASPT